MPVNPIRTLLLLLCLLPAPVLLAAHASGGEGLFQQNCAACHGENGDGGVGVPLNLPAFQASVDDHYLRQTIRLGRPGRVMPAFPSLSDEQIDAIIAYIRSWTGQPAPQLDTAPLRGDAENGGRLYASHCAACHGERGQGGHGTGVTMSRKRDLPILAPALVNRGFLASASDALIFNTIKHGRSGTPMPAFGQQGLSDAEIRDIIAWLRSRNPAPRTLPEHIEPVIVADSDYSYEETIQSIKDTIIGNNFRFIREQKLEQGFFPDDEVSDRETILYFCNFNFLYDAMNVDPRVGMFLPCRITVVERGGKVQVMAANPKAMSILFNNDELDKACDVMEQIYRDLIEEATL